MSGPAHDDLVRLVGATHEAVAHLPHNTDAVALYRSAAVRAEEVLPGPVGTAVAAVLAVEAAGARSFTILGASNPMLALAVAVLGLDPP